MTSSPHPQSRIGSTLARIAFVISVLFLALVILVFVAGAAVLRSFKPPSDMSELRTELRTCLDASSLSSVEISLPTWVATLGRVGASLADLDPEVKAALQTVAGGQIGVYELAERPSGSNALAMLRLADQHLEQEGWTRVVTVREEDALVAVYGLESSMRPGKTIEVFVIVLDERELVIASASGYAEPLFELASSAIDEFRF